MADQNNHHSDPQTRPVGGTEFSWCRAVLTGTGITVLPLLLSRSPDIQTLQTALHTLQNHHPILRTKLTTTGDTTTSTATTAAATSFTFTVSPTPSITLKTFDVPLTSQLLQTLPTNPSLSSFHQLLEHELNQNPWSQSEPQHTNPNLDTFFATLYSLEDEMWVVVLRIHTAICDRTAAVALLKEFVTLIGGGEKCEMEKKDEVNLGIEELIPSGKANKPFWARGVDLLGYSLNSMRFANLEFKDVGLPRSSGVVRWKMGSEETSRLLAGCKKRGIKCCGALAAAAIIASYSAKHLPDHQWEKYAVVTLVDSRDFLDPPLHSHNLGFYHTGILNAHDISGEAEFWELASRCYGSFKTGMNSNKHFSDMGDLNFLMCKAIDNPGLTPGSSMRTSLIAVFEDSVIADSRDLQKYIGLEDCVGCSSVHGVGPSIAIFDTIRNAGLDCACVFPLPLHSREQMQDLIDHMKRILVDGSMSVE